MGTIICLKGFWTLNSFPNRDLSASISLLTNAPSGGVYNVSTTTSNDRLMVDFPAALPGSRLRYRGKADSGSAFVSLNPAYEGYFAVRVPGNVLPHIFDGSDLEDLAGGKRSGQFFSSWVSIRSRDVSGQILWGSIPHGDVILESTDAVTLELWLQAWCTMVLCTSKYTSNLETSLGTNGQKTLPLWVASTLPHCSRQCSLNLRRTLCIMFLHGQPLILH